MKYNIAVALLALLTSCTTIELLDNWRDADASGDIKSLKKVLVMAYMNNEFSRIDAEEHLCAALNEKGIPSYKYFKNNSETSEQLYNNLRKEGFDGAVVIRMIAKEQRDKYVPGHFPSYYYDFQSYRRTAMIHYSQTSFLTGGVRHYIEINIYSIKRDILISSELRAVTGE